MTQRDLKSAEKAWKAFHQKGNPHVAFELSNPSGVWPKEWVCVGLCETIFYESDKWYSDGTWYKYFHHHGPNVRIWHPVGSSAAVTAAKFGKPRRDKLPIKSFPDAVAILGDSLGWKVKIFGAQEPVLAEVDQGELLACTPDQKHLVVLHPTHGVTAFLAGPALRVEPRGVVG